MNICLEYLCVSPHSDDTATGILPLSVLGTRTKANVGCTPKERDEREMAILQTGVIKWPILGHTVSIEPDFMVWCVLFLYFFRCCFNSSLLCTHTFGRNKYLCSLSSAGYAFTACISFPKYPNAPITHTHWNEGKEDVMWTKLRNITSSVNIS